MTDLKPCPFCGGSARQTGSSRVDGFLTAIIECGLFCGANVSKSAFYDRKQHTPEQMTAFTISLYLEVSKAWNTRADIVEKPDDKDGELERAYAKIGKLSDENDSLKKNERLRNDWLYKAKSDAGYNQNISFDEVWKYALFALRAGRS